jgi:hypothetical protein
VSFAADIANFCNMTCTFCLVFSIYVRYDVWLTWSKSIRQFTNMDDLVNTGVCKTMLIEILICLVAPYPFFNNSQYIEYNTDYEEETVYNLNDLLLFFSFIRLYLLCRFCFYLTHFQNPRT